MSVVQPWVSANCTFKMQTVMLCALRGCDTVRKEDPSKDLVRRLRATVLHNAEKKPALFTRVGAIKIEVLLEDLDHYPMHWVCHMAHACEIVGYKKPDEWFLKAYYGFAEAMHMLPESEAHLDIRLADQQYDKLRRQRYMEIGWPAPIIVEKKPEKTWPPSSRSHEYRG